MTLARAGVKGARLTTTASEALESDNINRTEPNCWVSVSVVFAGLTVTLADAAAWLMTMDRNMSTREQPRPRPLNNEAKKAIAS